MKSFVKDYEESFSIFRKKYEILYGTLWTYWRRNPAVVIPKKVTRIHSNAFFKKDMIEKITIPEGLKEIAAMSFLDCVNLKSVYISNLAAWCSISFDDDYANPLCQAKKLYLNGELITSLAIPEGITEIKNFAFEGCEPLTEVIIPSGVTRIGWSAFRDCVNLKSITIPNTVKFIGRSMIGGCINLKNIFYQGTKADWEAIEKWKIGMEWNAETGKYTIHCEDGDIEKQEPDSPSANKKKPEPTNIEPIKFATQEDENIFRVEKELKKEKRSGNYILVGMNPDRKPIYEEIGSDSARSFLVCSKGRKSEKQLHAVLRGMIASQRAFIGEEKKVYLFWKDSNWSQVVSPEEPIEDPLVKSKELLFEELYNETMRRIDIKRKCEKGADFSQIKKSWPWLIVFMRYSKKSPLPVQEWCEVASCWTNAIKILPVFFCDEVLTKSQESVFARVTNQLVFQASARQLRSYLAYASYTSKPYYEEEFLYWKLAHFLPLPEHLYVWFLKD